MGHSIPITVCSFRLCVYRQETLPVGSSEYHLTIINAYRANSDYFFSPEHLRGTLELLNRNVASAESALFNSSDVNSVVVVDSYMAILGELVPLSAWPSAANWAASQYVVLNDPRSWNDPQE